MGWWGVDAALAIQPGTESAAIKVVKEAGKVITVSGYNAESIPSERSITVAQLEHDDATQKEVALLVLSIADGTIQTEIEAQYPFEKALAALEKTETRHARGKVVVTMKRASS